MPGILVYGYGNPGRQDDGLGVLFAEKIEKWARQNQLDYISTNTNYQLNIEDAYDLNTFELVLFADASYENIDDFRLETIKPALSTNFSMHAVSPAFIVALCAEIYGHAPRALQLHIKGYQWEFMQPLTDKATQNLNKSIGHIQQKIAEKHL